MFKNVTHRPVFAIVISLIVVFLGLLAIKALPITQFPKIAPPRVIVALAYPGASADVLVKTTLIPLEQAINGVQGMRYMMSDSTSAGEATIQVIFEPGTDPNDAIVRVKNRVDQASNKLPELVRLEGIIVQPVQPSMLMYVNLYSNNKEDDEEFLYNYAKVNLLPELQRIKGVGRARILGNRNYAMRIWLNPDRMRAYNTSTEEVMEAISEQSIIGRPGRIGRSSGKEAQSLEYVLSYKGRFNEPKDYENIIIRANADGETLYLKNIAKIELDSEFYDIYSTVDGSPSAAILLKQTFDSNANEVIDEVKAKLKELSENFPSGMQYKITYDVSNFLGASITKVIHTIFEAFILVTLVVYVFLGDWRSTLIPILAVPVSLIGAFIFMQAFDLTINLVTLFAMVLAIGIVVDNAIVVVEAVHAKMSLEPISPFKAVKKVLGEITGAIVAITLVMTAVFIPIAFMSGPVGVVLKQFSITMASSIILSGIVALTLTPVLCVMLLKVHGNHSLSKNPVKLLLIKFNLFFEKVTNAYVAILQKLVHRKALTWLILGTVCLSIYGLNKIIPSGFIPNEDQSMLYAVIRTTPGSTLEKTFDVSNKLEKLALSVEGVESVSSLAGFEILTEGRGSNAGTCLINLENWDVRHHSVHQIMEELEEKAKSLGAIIKFFEPPAVPGYGASGGIALRLLDKTNKIDYKKLDELNLKFMEALSQRKELSGLITFYAANYPQYELVIDPRKAKQKGIKIDKAMENLNILIGSTYEQGFIRFGRFYKVYVQAAPEFRDLPSDVLKLYTKNDRDEMVPYSSFMTLKKTQGPNEITRFNLYNSSVIRAKPALGYTTGDAIKAVQEVAEQTLPRGYGIAWEGLSFDESKRGNEAIYIFFTVVLFVYLVLAAQYESFIIPFAVILSLPPGILGAFLLMKGMGVANDVYSQVGLIMLIALLGKNAVLIVEFARQKQQQGMTVLEASIEGARVRFRPILMTSLAFIAGLIPLVFASGAGAVSNHTIGGSALGGMILGTIMGSFIVPGLYYIFASIAKGRRLTKDENCSPLSEGLEN